MITSEQVNCQLGAVPEWSFLDNSADTRLESRDTLLITIGDSWTWGDSLGQACARESRDDYEYRLDNIYGNLIAKKLNADWINIAIPGESNTWIINQAERILNPDIINEYKTVYLILTLTEFGRKQDYDIFASKRNQITLDNIFGVYNQEIEQRINRLILANPGVKILAGYNFVDPAIPNNFLPDTWLDLLHQDNAGTCHIVLSEHIDILSKWLMELTDIPVWKIKTWAMDLIDCSLVRIDRLDRSPHNHTQDSRHPTETGHAIWAEYLLQNLLK